ncbi:MAG TPA: hypothetical protein VJX94_26575 [Stellaceae bacterium]|nr:hypothetical protein [Stellaceae bacterium]
MRLVAQYADQWNISLNSADGLAAVRDAVDKACTKLGRDPATLQRTVHALIDLPGLQGSEVSEAVLAHRAARGPATGSSEELVEHLRAFERAGIDHVQLWLEPNTMAGIDAFLPVLELLDRG